MQKVNTSRLTSSLITEERLSLGEGELKSPNLALGGSQGKKSPRKRPEKMEDDLPGAGWGGCYECVEGEEWHFSGCG